MARDDVAQTEAQMLVLSVRRLINHPAVIAAGLQPTLNVLVEYLARTDTRLQRLERLTDELARREFARLGPQSVAALRMLHPAAPDPEFRLRALGLWQD